MSADQIEIARQQLRRALTDQGILASTVRHANYRRIWARDSVICGLAGLLHADEGLREGLRRSLDCLVRHCGPQGQIPSNLQIGENGQTSRVSYGGLCGRVDSIPWYIIGVLSDICASE